MFCWCLTLVTSTFQQNAYFWQQSRAFNGFVESSWENLDIAWSLKFCLIFDLRRREYFCHSLYFMCFFICWVLTQLDVCITNRNIPRFITYSLWYIDLQKIKNTEFTDWIWFLEQELKNQRDRVQIFLCSHHLLWLWRRLNHLLLATHSVLTSPQCCQCQQCQHMKNCMQKLSRCANQTRAQTF